MKYEISIQYTWKCSHITQLANHIDCVHSLCNRFPCHRSAVQVQFMLLILHRFYAYRLHIWRRLFALCICVVSVESVKLLGIGFSFSSPIRRNRSRSTFTKCRFACSYHSEQNMSEVCWLYTRNDNRMASNCLFTQRNHYCRCYIACVLCLIMFNGTFSWISRHAMYQYTKY